MATILDCLDEGSSAMFGDRRHLLPVSCRVLTLQTDKRNVLSANFKMLIVGILNPTPRIRCRCVLFTIYTCQSIIGIVLIDISQSDLDRTKYVSLKIFLQNM